LFLPGRRKTTAVAHALVARASEVDAGVAVAELGEAEVVLERAPEVAKFVNINAI
jgi:hypothetical protein